MGVLVRGCCGARPRSAALVADRRVRAPAGRSPRSLITVNWATYIWGVNNGRVVETSLGYFINPLVTVLMGVFILGERLRRCSGRRWRSPALRRGGADASTTAGCRWVALVLAFSFGSYGLARSTPTSAPSRA